MTNVIHLILAQGPLLWQRTSRGLVRLMIMPSFVLILCADGGGILGSAPTIMMPDPTILPSTSLPTGRMSPITVPQANAAALTLNNISKPIVFVCSDSPFFYHFNPLTFCTNRTSKPSFWSRAIIAKKLVHLVGV